MKIVKRLSAGELSPRGFRPAYYDWFSNSVVYYPVGLHLVARLVRRIWELMFWIKASRLEKLMEAVRRRAVQDYMRNNPPRKLTWGDIGKLLGDVGNRSNLP